MIGEYIGKIKNQTIQFLTEFKKQAVPIVASVNPLGKDAVDRLIDFSCRGKLVRSVLLRLSYDMVSTQKTSVLPAVSGALELMYSALLMQDDVMDRDEQRRGKPSMHVQFRHQFEKQTNDPSRTGESLAVCVSDLAIFLAFRTIGEVSLPDKIRSAIMKTMADSYMKVVTAQMQDVLVGDLKEKKLTQKEILNLYKYKTGRYTTSPAIVIGALIADAQDSVIKKLWKTGDSLGIMYQIIDDRLNIFGNENVTGKPVGSDIREDKQTLYRCLLFERCSGTEQKKLLTVFGNPHVTPEDIAYIRKTIISYHIDEEINSLITTCLQTVKKTVRSLHGTENGKRQFLSFVDFIANRVQ